MQNDGLRILLAQVENVCRQQHLSIFYGEIVEPHHTLVQWEQREDNDWQGFLEVLKRAAVPLITLTIQENNLEADDAETIRTYRHTLDEEQQEAFDAALEVVKGCDGHLLSLTLTFFLDGVAYQYEMIADWEDHYYTVLEAFDPPEEEAAAPNEAFCPTELEQVAQAILKDPGYLSGKNFLERRKATAVFLQKQGIADRLVIFEIYKVVDALYKAEVQPLEEQEIKTKIQELKQKGLTKVEVKSRLGITTTTLNKYWY